MGAVSSHRQLVCSLDMVNRSRAPACSPVPGDAVLSPWEPDLRRYGPGRVTVAPREAMGFTEELLLEVGDEPAQGIISVNVTINTTGKKKQS